MISMSEKLNGAVENCATSLPGKGLISPHLSKRPTLPLQNSNMLPVPQMYIYRWDRQGRKGQTCRVTARGKFNLIRVVFDDGYTMITSGNAIRKVAS